MNKIKDFIKRIELKFSFKWFDFWIGFYFDRRARAVYFCPVPMCVLRFGLKPKLKLIRGIDFAVPIVSTMAVKKDQIVMLDAEFLKNNPEVLQRIQKEMMESIDRNWLFSRDELYDQTRKSRPFNFGLDRAAGFGDTSDDEKKND